MVVNTGQVNLFGLSLQKSRLPVDYEPARPEYLTISQIYLARGSLSTPERRRFIERICRLYPEAEIKECLDTPHNRIELNKNDVLALHRIGKRTLVFGELKSAVRFSEEEGNTCPNYWHFSPYGFCPYGCKYCYPAGTHGVKYSPTVKIYVNLPEMLEEVDRLLEFRHQGHTILSWSVNPPEVCQTFEANVPAIEDRLEAMRRAASSGYPVRAVMMPIIPIEGWQDIYSAFTQRLLGAVPLQRLTLGGICSYKAARALMESKLGSHNVISANMGNLRSSDGRARYDTSLRNEIYARIIAIARALRPDLEIALCLEEDKLWSSSGLDGNRGRCNCVL